MKKRIAFWMLVVTAALVTVLMVGCPNNPNEETYTVKIGALTGGRVSVSNPAAATSSGVTANTLISLTVTPNNGMKLKSGTLKYTGETSGASTAISNNRFNMPAENVIVTAEFEEGEAVFEVTDIKQWDAELLDIIGEMTTLEKIGQTMQVAEQLIRNNSDNFTTHFLGSWFPNAGTRPTGGGNEPENWVPYINGYQDKATATRLGIPMIIGVDAVHGHNSLTNATIFPHNSGLGAIAAGDLRQGIEAAQTAGRITAEELLASGFNWTFAPQITVPHDVRWGRAFEAFGEDAETVAAMSKASIQGLQANGVAACAKHYGGEGWNLNAINGENGRAGTAESPLTDEQLQDQLLPYRAAIEAGIFTVMPALSQTNGIWVHRNKELLTDVLKNDLGFDGFIVADWNGSRTGTDLRDSFNAGIDMHMNGEGDRGNYVNNITTINNYITNGQISMERLDDAVLRILRVKRALNLLPDYTPSVPGQVGTPENRANARRIAAKTLTLMENKNQTIQKLRTANRILITGQAADNMGMQCGGWTYGWQGQTNIPTTGTTIVDGIRKAIGEDKVTLSNTTANSATTAISGGPYDAIIAVIGEGPHAEHIGDRGGNNGLPNNNPTIPLRVGGGEYNSPAGNFNDVGMLNAIYTYIDSNPDVPLTVIMLSGRPMSINSSATPASRGEHYLLWDAFVVAWLPGSETGDAVADVLFTDMDFVGRSPYTWRTSYATNPGPAAAGTYPSTSEVIYDYGHGYTKANSN